MDTYKVLVLNVTFEPIGITSSRSVIKKIISGNSISVEKYYPFNYITAGFKQIPIPAVVRTYKYISLKSLSKKSCSRSDIYSRDSYTCVYCGDRPSLLTVDHVIPKCRGGPTSYDNLVTACMRCNNRKGDKTLDEAGFSLIKKVPTSYNSVLANILKHGKDNVYWRDFLYT